MTAKKSLLLCLAFAAFLLPSSCTLFEIVTMEERVDYFITDLNSGDESVRLSMDRHFYSRSSAVGGSLSDPAFWNAHFPLGEEYRLENANVDDDFTADLFSTVTYAGGAELRFSMYLFDQTWYIRELVLNGTVLVKR